MTKLFVSTDLKRISPLSTEHRCATVKATGILPGRLLNVPMPNPSMGSMGTGTFDEPSGVHSSYHWDCSDWVRRSHNPLPNISEVPGSEVPDSSSFHSNESNESHPKNNIMPLREF